MTRRPRGQLVIIGGRGDKDGDPAILDEFVRLAGGADARMVVTTVAPRISSPLGVAPVRRWGCAGPA